MRRPLRWGCAWATAALACAAAALAAMEWPLASATIAATFGTTAAGRLVTGIALAADEGLAHAVEDGELIFVSDGLISASGLPSTLGTFAVVEHSRNIAGVYSHLDPGSVPANARRISAGDAVGSAGSSGWAEGKGILFQSFDRQESRWVNPLLLLPPQADKKPPVIRSLSLIRGGKAYTLGGTVSVGQGSYALALETSDVSDSGWNAGPLAPYSIRLLIDGAVVANDLFDVAGASGGELAFFSESPRAASLLRGGDGKYVLAERFLARGRVVFEAQVEDASGNGRSASWSVLVE